MNRPIEINQLLVACAEGDRQAHEQLICHIYEELRTHSSRAKTGFYRFNLDTTDLLHETYMRLLNQDGYLNYKNRRHLFGAFMIATERVLIDHARQTATAKRGGDFRQVPLEKHLLTVLDDERILEIADLLDTLQMQDEIAANVARARLFRYSIPEIAKLMELEPSVVEAKWAFARACLRMMVEPASP